MPTIIATGKCPLCGKPSQIEVDNRLVPKIKSYLNNRHPFGPIQSEFPDLTPGQRETLLTGSHEDCYDTFALEFEEANRED